MILSKTTWNAYASAIATEGDPFLYSPAAMERLMVDFDKYIVKVKGVKSQFRAINSIDIIDFRCEEDKKFYDDAYARYLAEKAKIEGRADGGSRMDILVQLIKFQQAAEIVKSASLAEAMYLAVQNGKAAVAGLKYKASIGKLVKILHDDYGVERDSISLIWGGGNTSVSKKKKDKLDLKSKLTTNAEIMAILEEGGIDMYDLGLGAVSEAAIVEVDDSLRLGAQTREERQKEIDRFQRGTSLYAAFTYKSGGVGLSLHHTDELTKQWNIHQEGFIEWLRLIPERDRPFIGKVRRKPSGYAVEADIPFIATRPREAYLAVTYSAIELVQALGRCPRLTSLSDTYQKLMFYRGTIEERIAKVQSIKLRCLKKVTRQKETWDAIILGNKTEEDYSEPVNGDPKLLENDSSDDNEIPEIEDEEDL